MSTPNDNGSEMVYHEIHAVVKRYIDEAPDMTVFQVIGALEAVKHDLMDHLKTHNEDGEIMRRIHVIPIGDSDLHAAQETCWCYPTQTEPRVFVHNAADCREAKERSTGQGCSEGWINIAEIVSQ